MESERIIENIPLVRKLDAFVALSEVELAVLDWNSDPGLRPFATTQGATDSSLQAVSSVSRHC